MAAGVIGFIGRLRLAEGDDADLLRAYARGRDADAFAELVRRHGGRVWATCRRVSGDPHAAEDAFQATFLVLARRAAGLDPAGRPLGGWLHAVAVNVSVRARTAAGRRRRREVREVEVVAPEPPDPPDEQALAALDEEIERLPAKLRDAVVLCELDGLSRKDAATRLGVAEGTLSSRLAAARKRLADRLTDRGVRPELLAVPAAVPAGLAAAACGASSAAVVALTGGTMRALLLKGLTAGAVACGLLAVGVQAKDEPPAKPAEPPRAAKPVAVREGVILLTSFALDHPAELFKPDGTLLGEPPFGEAGVPWRARLSPDGEQVAVLHSYDDKPRDRLITPADYEQERRIHPWGRTMLHIFPLGEGGSPAAVLPELRQAWGAWGPGGRQFYGSEVDIKHAKSSPGDLPAVPYVSWVYDVTARTKTPLAVPDGHAIVDVSADGRRLLTMTVPLGRNKGEGRCFVVPTDSYKPEPADGLPLWGMRLSPDGTRLLASRPLVGGNDLRSDLVVRRLADGAETVLPLPDGQMGVHQACWSPDGRRVAYVWQEGVEPADAPPRADGKPSRWTASRVSVADADGRNAKVIVRRESNQSVTSIDWR